MAIQKMLLLNIPKKVIRNKNGPEFHITLKGILLIYEILQRKFSSLFNDYLQLRLVNENFFVAKFVV